MEEDDDDEFLTVLHMIPKTEFQQC